MLISCIRSGSRRSFNFPRRFRVAPSTPQGLCSQRGAFPLPLKVNDLKNLLNNFRMLPLAHKCVLLVELLAIALLPFFIGAKQAQAAPVDHQVARYSAPVPLGSANGSVV